MKKHTEKTAPHQTLRAFAESDDDAAFRLFAQLCRSSPALREWLWEEFARKPKTREQFAATLAQQNPDPDHDAEAFVENRPLQIETARLRESVSGRIYGGLTWGDVETLIRHYQAGKLDLGTFLLASEWRHAYTAASVPPRLVVATVDWFRAIASGGETRLLRHAEKTIKLLASLEITPKRRGLFGHTDWWKLNVLFYMLRHPRESYRTREFRSYLADLGIEVGTKDIRRFCSRHGIRRDVRAGRPKAQ